MAIKRLTIKQITQIAASLALVLIVLAFVSVCLFPQNLKEFGRASFIWTILLLLAYFIFCSRIPTITAKANYTVALEQGTKWGVIAGVFNIIHLTVECFVSMPHSIDGIVTLGFMGILFILFGVPAYFTLKNTRRTGPSLFSSIWCAMSSILILFAYGFLIDAVFMPRMKTILQFDEDLKLSRMSLDAFVIHNTLESGGTHLLEAPIIAVVFGLFAIGINKVVRQFG